MPFVPALFWAMSIKLLPHYTFLENIHFEVKARNKHRLVKERYSRDNIHLKEYRSFYDFLESDLQISEV